MTHVWEQAGAFALLGPFRLPVNPHCLNIISGLLKPSTAKWFGLMVNASTNFEPERTQYCTGFPVSRGVRHHWQYLIILACPLRNIRRCQNTRWSHKVYESRGNPRNCLTQTEKQSQRLYRPIRKKSNLMGRGLVRRQLCRQFVLMNAYGYRIPQLKWKLRRKLKQIHEQFNITMVWCDSRSARSATFCEKNSRGDVQRTNVQFGTPRELFEIRLIPCWLLYW